MQGRDANEHLGKSVLDAFGRQVGSLLGYSVNPSGEVVSIGVDRGPEGFEVYESDRFRFEDEAFVVTPRWAAESQEMERSLGGVQKRLVSLKQLAKDMGISKAKFDQMIKKSDRELYASLQSRKVLAELIALRGFEIESQTEELDDFVANLTAQFNAGAIDRTAYAVTTEYCRDARNRNVREVQELSKTLKGMANPGENQVADRLAQIEGEPEAVIQRQARSKRPQLISEIP